MNRTVRGCLGIAAVSTTLVCQIIALLFVEVPSDLFLMSTAAAFFFLVLSTYLLWESEKPWTVASAFFMMLFVGMRFDAAPALNLTAALVTGCAVMAVWGQATALLKHKNSKKYKQ
ncbi:hypothetical protein QM007_05180 [Rothia sp. SD9660Na]|uniref:hypothetical protein n=1 Tax=Rothia sp. SD9660Na TaxID=3047030 RepID=UPI0024B8D0D6|nr:hypothetical protein [Rothia sp. SD9660Na]WHS51353.1 hypothetical protein QM007_05180 [Rothia sp. SD9660Na]